MSTAAIDLGTSLTSLTNVTSLGPTRQVCVAGASSDFSIEVFAAPSANSPPTLRSLARITGANVMVVLSGDSSPALTYTVLAGSLGSGKVWVQGSPSSAVTAIPLSTSFTDTSGFSLGRTYNLGGAPAGLVATLYVADATNATKFTPLIALTPDQNGQASTFLPWDASVAIKVVYSGTPPNGSTIVWVSGGSVGATGVGQIVSAGIVNSNGTALNGYGYTVARTALGIYKVTMTSAGLTVNTPIFCKLYKTGFPTAQWVEYASSLINGGGFLEFTVAGLTDTNDIITSLDVAFEFFVLVTGA